MELQLEEWSIETNGIRLHAVAAGPEEGPLVILLHGFPEFWYSWRRQIEPLARAGYRVVVPDQRGYNLSDKPSRIADYSIDKLALDIVGIIDFLGRKKAFVAGHDWGAAVTWWLATFHSDRIESAAVLNVPHPRVMQKQLLSSPSQLLKSWYMFFFQFPRLPELLIARHDFSFGARSLRGSSTRGTFSDEDLRQYKSAWGQKGALRSMVNWYRAAFRSARLGQASASWQIKVPLLIIWGTEDRFLGAEMASMSLLFCENGRLELLDGVSHWVQHEQPEKVAGLLRAHFVSA